jgi:LDH2 family malate/lactate/ureidoglycolate dehydrogenase
LAGTTLSPPPAKNRRPALAPPNAALQASAPLLRDKARHQGIAAVAIRDSHHFAALWPDIEPFAGEGFIALAVVNGRQRMAVWDGKRKVLGTNPMAFACPRPGHKPIVWDQAASVIAQGEVLIAYIIKEEEARWPVGRFRSDRLRSST